MYLKSPNEPLPNIYTSIHEATLHVLMWYGCMPYKQISHKNTICIAVILRLLW